MKRLLACCWAIRFSSTYKLLFNYADQRSNGSSFSISPLFLWCSDCTVELFYQCGIFCFSIYFKRLFTNQGMFPCVLFVDSDIIPFVIITMRTNLSSFVIYHRVCNKSNTTGATSGTGTAFPSEAPEFTHGL